MNPAIKDSSSAATPLTDQAARLADQAAERADHAIRSGQRMSDRGFEQLSDRVDDMHRRATPLLNRLSGRAEAVARRGAGAMRDATHQVRARALRVSDSTVDYVRDEPVKSMLMAAAAGAVMMAVLGFLRGRGRD